jgi:hypothetical protein
MNKRLLTPPSKPHHTLLPKRREAPIWVEEFQSFRADTYRGAMSAAASDELRFALGVDSANEQMRKFTVIKGGAA